jgi:hypothetical protein
VTVFYKKGAEELKVFGSPGVEKDCRRLFLNGRQQKSDQEAGRRDHHKQFDQRETGHLADSFVVCFHIHSSLFIVNL